MNERQFADRIGNIDDQLVEEARYRRRKGGRWGRRFLAAAAVVALMAASFTVGALAFRREVPTEQEMIELPGIGLTLILPDSWKGHYGVEMNEEGTYCGVYVKLVHEKYGIWEDGQWLGEGYLFRVGKAYDEPLTPVELEERSPVPCRYLFSTAEGTYSMDFASDVQYDPYDPEQTREYLQLWGEKEQIRFLVDGVLSD